MTVPIRLGVLPGARRRPGGASRLVFVRKHHGGRLHTQPGNGIRPARANHRRAQRRPNGKALKIVAICSGAVNGLCPARQPPKPAVRHLPTDRARCRLTRPCCAVTLLRSIFLNAVRKDWP